MIRCKELPTDLKEGEEIRDIDGFDGKYAVTNFGRVWAYPNSTRSKGHWLKPRIDNHGYARVGLYLGNKKYKLIFIEKRRKTPVFRHGDMWRIRRRRIFPFFS